MMRPGGVAPEALGRGLPLDYAQGIAEALARLLGLERLVAADTHWRLGVPSEKTVGLPSVWGLPSRRSCGRVRCWMRLPPWLGIGTEL